MQERALTFPVGYTPGSEENFSVILTRIFKAGMRNAKWYWQVNEPILRARGSSHRQFAGPFIEDILAERGITVSHASIRLWCI